MNVFNKQARLVPWFTAAVLSVIMSGCGGGSAGQAPILGIGGAVTTAAPLVTSVSPLPGATAVPVNTRKITAVFNKAMDDSTLNAASFTLACPGTTLIAGTAVTYTTNGNLATLTIPSASVLPTNTLCTASVTSAAKDTSGVALASTFKWNFTTGTAPDTTPPTVTSTINANGATGVSVNAKVGATFSEAMDVTSINTGNFRLNQGTTAIEGTVSYVGVSAVWTPSTPLATNTTYTVTVKGGAGGVKDVAGNVMVKDFVIRWTTGTATDTTPPTVTGTINANDASNVPVNTKVGATFSEGMDPLTITNANFTLKVAADGVPVSGTVSYSGLSTVFIPLAGLTANTRYTGTIKGSTDGVKDLAGNAMVSDYVWSWTTGSIVDTTPPTVTGTNNANGANNVATNTIASATFSEGMNPLTITNQSFTMKESVSGNAIDGTVDYSGVTAQFKPLDVLAGGTRYTLTINGASGGVTDLADNAMVNDYVWSWTTAVNPDTTAPTVIGTIHANGESNVAVNTSVGATFSEAMDVTTVTNANFSVKETVSGNAVTGTVNYAGVNALFVPTNGLANVTNYTVTVRGGANGVKDLAGNAMVSDFVISWTTAALPDTTAPTIFYVDPDDLATNVAITRSVDVFFSEAMNPLTMSNANFSIAGVSGLVSYNAASKRMTFTPTSNFANGITYTATVSTGVTDLAGNAMADAKTWSFTTVAPVVVVVPPLGAASIYGTYGGSAGMTNQGTATVVNGSIGTTATGTSSITGFHDNGIGVNQDIYTETPLNAGFVNGSIYTCTVSTTGPTSAAVNPAACTQATAGLAAASAAYNALVAFPPGANPGGDLGGLTLAPGVYTAPAGSFQISSPGLTLDAQGDANATWVFQMATTLTVGPSVSITLAGGAQAKNVYWQVGTAATINPAGGGTMVGNIISQAGIAFSTAGNVSPVTLNGRALSLGASVTLVNTVINVP